VTTTTFSAQDRKWMAAARDGLLDDPDKPAGVTTADGMCLAKALIAVVTVARLKSAGVTINDLRAANELPESLYRSLPDATKLTLGAAAQKCRMGHMVGPEFARSIQRGIDPAKANPAAGRCMSDALDSVPHRRLAAGMMLLDSPGAREAPELTDIILTCVDWAALFGAELKLTLVDKERVCINRTTRGDFGFRQSLIAQLSGNGNGNTGAARLGQRIIPCLTPQHFAQVAKPSHA
jgi:hypothetical protein